jgi:hypothetical protein
LLFISIQTQASQDNADRPIGSREDKASFIDNQLWPIDQTTGTYRIKVCWMFYADMYTEENIRLREMVKKSIQDAWHGPSQRDATTGLIFPQNNGYSLVDFNGWIECTLDDLNNAVKIKVDDDNYPGSIPESFLASPYVTALGANLKAQDKYVHLNFKMENAAVATIKDACGSSLDLCIKLVSVHEFGHVLGMGHGHLRKDAPGCGDAAGLFVEDVLFGGFFVGEAYIGNSYFTDYDQNSIMNYCNENRFKSYAVLPSETDRLAVQAFYGGVPTFRNNKLTIPRLVVTGTENSNGVVRVVMDWNPGTKQFKIIPDTYSPSAKPSTATPRYSISFGIASISFPLVVEYTPDGQHIQRIIEDAKLRHIDDGTPYGAFIIDGELKTKSPTTFPMGSLY